MTKDLEFLDDKKPIINEILKRYLPEKLDSEALEKIFGKPRFAYDEHALSEVLSKPIWDFLERGGKRIRPIFFLLLAEALGLDIEKVKDFSIMVEFAHEGSIMIDDVEDAGELRRGKPCTHKIFGEDVAINAGNFMYVLPMLVLLRNRGNFDDDVLLNAYEVFVQEMINIHAGQGMDIYWHRGNQENIKEEEYLQMCAYKTGCLMRMAARMAAVLNRVDKESEKGIGNFAEMIGIGFQIQDDVLSASGSEFQDKKGFGDDITEGKRTLIVIHALKNANETDRKRLLEILNMHTRDTELIKEAMALLNKYGSLDYARTRSKELVKQAWEKVDPLLAESEAKDRIKTLATFLIERDI